MSDNLQVTATKTDGTVVAITGALTNSTVVETPPAVVPPPIPLAPTIPATAKVVNMLIPPGAWEMNHDLGTPGTVPAIATTYPVTAPDGTVNCRQFTFTTTALAGAIFHTAAIPSGASAYNRFAYKKREMYLKAIPKNCETDLEITGQATGIPYDMAMQQDGYSGVEDITINHVWTGTNVKVNPTTRKTGVWYESVEYVGFDPVAKQIIYFGVLLDDGVYYPINKTVADADNAVWQKDMLNFQQQYDSGQTVSTDYVILCSLLEVDAWAV